MASICYTPLRLRRVRITQLDECGNPVYAEENPAPGDLPIHVVPNGTVSLATAPVYEDADEFIQKDGFGDLCVNQMGEANLKRYELTFSFCGVDPEAYSFITGSELIYNAEGVAIGFADSERTMNTRFAIEAWVGVAGVSCGDGDLPWGYMIHPFVTNGSLGEMTFANELTTFEFTAHTKSGGNWGNGPYDVMLDGDSPPAPGPLLTPIGALEHRRKFITTVAPPAPSCGVAEES